MVFDSLRVLRLPPATFCFLAATHLLLYRCDQQSVITYSSTTRLQPVCAISGILFLIMTTVTVRQIQIYRLERLETRFNSLTVQQLIRAIAGSAPIFMVLVCITSDDARDCNGKLVSEPEHAWGVGLWAVLALGVEVVILQREEKIRYVLTLMVIGVVGLLFLIPSMVNTNKDGIAPAIGGWGEFVALVGLLWHEVRMVFENTKSVK